MATVTLPRALRGCLFTARARITQITPLGAAGLARGFAVACRNAPSYSKATARRGLATNSEFSVVEDYGDRLEKPLSPPQATVFRSELTPISFLERSARIFPTQTAMYVPAIGDHPERSYTYREFGQRVRKLADKFIKEGLKKGDKVAYVVPNTVAGLEAHFAVAMAGGVVVMINTRLKPTEITYILNHSKAKFLFIDHELAPPFQALTHPTPQTHSKIEVPHLQKVVVVRDNGDPATCTYEAFLASGTAHPWHTYPGLNLESERDCISICYTSGTTGMPKGVQYEYRGAYLNALGQLIEMGMNQSSSYLWILPQFHCNGWTFPWAVTAASATHILLRKIDYDVIWDLLKNKGVTHYCGAPTVQTFLTNNPNKTKLPKEVKVMVAGSPPSPSLIASMNELNLVPVHVYGLTETFGPTSICLPQPSWSSLDATALSEKVSRQGVNNIVSDPIRVVNPETMVDVPPDGKTVGEIVMRGNVTMMGYLDDPVATAKAFAGGWFRSGDLAVCHPDGYICGENISSVEVENTILAHPKVLEACVIATPDDFWGERPKAFVVLKPSALEHEAVDPGQIEREIMEFCRARLANYKCPARVQLERELPKTGTGKIQKFVLRNAEWAGKTKGGKTVN